MPPRLWEEKDRSCVFHAKGDTGSRVRCLSGTASCWLPGEQTCPGRLPLPGPWGPEVDADSLDSSFSNFPLRRDSQLPNPGLGEDRQPVKISTRGHR